MCGRFTLAKSPGEVAAAFPGLPAPSRLGARYNIAPGQPVCAWLADPSPRWEIFSWGLVPHWAKDPAIASKLINARAETLPEKPSFRDAFRRKRCVVPADGWYEWKREGVQKTPVYFRRRDGNCFGLAGLWDAWHGKDGSFILSLTLVTTRPNSLARSVHPRMPAVLRAEDVEAWLAPKETDPGRLSHMLAPVASDEFEVYPVSPAVNRVSNDSPRLIEPVADTPSQGELFS